MIYASFVISGLAIAVSGVQVYYVNQIRKLQAERRRRIGSRSQVQSP